ncbi:MAG: hypothetical protein NT175_03090 [Bacteroidetes bacterium]|nr:hypothetical protein [Bacteroidota bacterium]
MTLLQIDSLKNLGSNPSFWDNFIWPLSVLIAAGIGGLIWNFLIRKRIIIKIHYSNSYRGTFNGNHYIILNTKIINEKSSAINIEISASNMSNIRNGITIMTQGGRMSDGPILIPAPIQIINNVLFPPINIPAESNKTGNIVIEIQSELLEEIKVRFNYLNKGKTKTIKIRMLQCK